MATTLPRLYPFEHREYVHFRDRVESFYGVNVRLPQPTDALAENGYFAKENKTICFYCNHTLRFDEWQIGEDLTQRHLRESPDCTHAKKIAYINKMKTLDNRFQTFRTYRWNQPLPTPERLARAGFFFRSNGTTMCAYCKGVIERWTQTDNPLEKHSTRFPACPFVLNPPTYALGEDIPPAQPAPPLPDRKPGFIAHRPPKHSNMVSIDTRLASFRNWHHESDKKKLAEAGFFYLHNKDWTKCFHCGGGLLNWDKDDDPWIEHARWYPRCEFVRLTKGDEFIDAIAKQHKDTLKPLETETDVLDQELNILMEGDDVKMYAKLGINKQVMKMVLKKFMTENGRGFDSHDEFLKVLGSTTRMRGAVTLPSPPRPTDAPLCKVCATRELGALLLPCKHLACCGQCAASVSTCPICREDIEEIVHVYV